MLSLDTAMPKYFLDHERSSRFLALV